MEVMRKKIYEVSKIVNENGLLRNRFFLSLVCVDTTATGWFFIDDSN